MGGKYLFLGYREILTVVSEFHCVYVISSPGPIQISKFLMHAKVQERPKDFFLFLVMSEFFLSRFLFETEGILNSFILTRTKVLVRIEILGELSVFLHCDLLNKTY